MTTRTLHIVLWVAQVILAGMFGPSAAMKVALPIPDLAARFGWPGVVPEALVRFIGASELAGALGMLLPAATRIQPWLTPVAGVGLAVIMVLAAAFHLSRGELSALPTNIALGVVAAFVAWGRFTKARIAPR